MRIVTVSDIHLDMNSKYAGVDLLPAFIRCLKRCDADFIIIAGDLCDKASDTIQSLNLLEEQLGKKVLFIPGNHDVWVKQGEQSSWDCYHLLKNHPSSLLGKPFEINDTHVIIGEMGWFDYSFVKEDVSKQTVCDHLQDWGDHKWTEWGMADKELSAKMLQSIESQLKQYQHKKIILVHHFVPYKDFLTGSTVYMNWDVYNAFMGSESAGRLFDSYSNIEYVIFGHTHDRCGVVHNYHHKTIICNPLGYIAERSEALFEEELRKSIVIFDI